MRTCEGCIYCKPACDGKHLFGCILSKKRFDTPRLHGWFCNGLGKSIFKKEKKK